MKKITEKDRAILDSVLSDYNLTTDEVLAAVAAKRSSDQMCQKDSGQASPWISRSAAAKLASLSTDTIDNLRHDGLIASIKLNRARAGRVLIDRASLLAYLNSFVGKEVSQS